MSFPRYPKYKASGVEWLGDVPEGWGAAPFKRQIARNDGGVWGDDPDGFADTIVLRSTEQTVDGKWQLDNPAPRKLTEPEINSALLAEGDLLLTKSSGSSLHIGKTTLVTAEIAAMRCCYSNFMQRIRTKTTFLPKLAWYVLNNQLARQQLDLLSNSTTGLANLNATMVGQLVVIVPPLPEQTAIAEFLDRETAKLDGLVAEQRQLMELLKEKRQAVISHAVTKGLNPHAPMKPSGIEWLGDVPVGWEVRRLKSIVDEPLKYGANESAELDDRTLPRFVRITDIDDAGALRDETFKSLPVEVAEPFLLREGDVLLARSGATVGKSFIYSNQWGPACFAGYLIRARLRHTTYLAKWLYLFCQTSGYWGYVVGSQIQATIQNVSAEKYANLYLALPLIAEQTAIIEFLDAELAKFDTLTAEAQRAIDLLQERRTALISAAVTGQIDVRQQPRN